MRRTGSYVKTTTLGETVQAFVPRALPPAEPPLAAGDVLERNHRAQLALARLSGVSGLVPSVDWLLYSAIRKEALLTSQIEGTQATLTDLFDDEAGFAVSNTEDVEEVTNYLRAFRFVRDNLRSARGLPISVRLLNEAHKRLLDGARGAGKQPGELRRSQNWIGGTRPGNATFVPPPPDRVMERLASLETFLHDRETYPVLIRAALAHAQFETIHPFLDGNGRLGRLLITLMLCEERALKEPILYLSLYFKQNRSRYYELLQEVRQKGDWEAWLEFFLNGVTETSEQGVASARRLLDLFARDREKIAALGRPASSALRLHTEFQRTPLLSMPVTAKKLGMSQPTAQKSLEHLQEIGIITEITGKQRGRLYEYTSYLKILDEGTAFLVEPDPASLGRGLARLLRDRPLRLQLARNAKAYVQREFTPQAAQRKLEAFYSAIEARVAERSA